MVKFLLIILLLVQSYIYATNIELDDVIARYIKSISDLEKMASFGAGSNVEQFMCAGMALQDLKKLCESDGYVICKLESRMMLQNMGLIDVNGKIYQFVKEAFRKTIFNPQL